VETGVGAPFGALPNKTLIVLNYFIFEEGKTKGVTAWWVGGDPLSHPPEKKSY
jgi:hypothetical protein